MKLAIRFDASAAIDEVLKEGFRLAISSSVYVRPSEVTKVSFFILECAYEQKLYSFFNIGGLYDLCL